jgi:hypothetical protein
VLLYTAGHSRSRFSCKSFPHGVTRPIFADADNTICKFAGLFSELSSGLEPEIPPYLGVLP